MELIIIAAVIVVLFLFVFLDGSRSEKSIMRVINAGYGKPRENTEERYERIGEAAKLFLKETESCGESDIVDDITWNDLGMDEIFVTANHTDCYVGEQYLYNVMRRLDADESELEERDRRADFFDKDKDKRNAVRRVLYGLGQSPSGFRLIDNISDIRNKHLKYRWLYPLLPAVLIILTAAVLITRIPVLLFAAIILAIFSIIIHTLVKDSVEVSLQTIFNVVNIINAARSISAEVPEMSSDIGEDLKKLSGILKKSGLMAAEKSAEATRNTMMIILFYVIDIFMIDLICYEAVIDDIADKTEEFMRVFRYVGSMDYVISLSSYRRYTDNYCIPEFSDTKAMSFRDVYHPLIRDAVGNDIDYDRNTIITGSNASGKSTFIKSVAIALILGQTLHICHAESAVISRCVVMTSMAVRDDVLSGESYYIREIRYLKRMVERCGDGKLMFLAVDEILRGTNTRERIAASKAIMEYFLNKNCMMFIATHDMELADHFSGKCDNYHFCETVEEGDVVFDYKIHKGISTTSNAIRLLKAMGFPDDIVSSAEKYSSQEQN